MEEDRGFPNEPQGEPVGASHRRVRAQRLEIDSDGVVVWSGCDGMVVWSGGDGGFSLFHSLRFSLSDYMWVLVCFEFLLWVSQIGMDWISKSAAGTEDRRRQRGGLEIGGDGGFSLSLIPILSLTLLLSLRLDVGFGFALNFLQVQSKSFCFSFFFFF